jgi:mannosyltransferase
VGAVRISAVAASVGALTALATIVRFAGIGHQSYWYDEAHTVWLLHFSLAGMVSRLNASETSPPLYFLLAWVWAHVFGYGPGAVRSLSALAGVATVPVAYAAAARFCTRRVGVVVAALTACSPLLVWYSQEARSYSLMVLFTTIALLAFAHLRERPSRGWAIAWGIAAVLAIWTHYYAALAIGAQWVWLLARHRRTRSVRIALETTLVGGAALMPLALLQMGFLSANDWIAKIPLSWRAADVPKTFAIGPAAPAATVLLAITAVAVAISLLLLITRAEPDERRRITFVARLAAAGAVIVVALIVAGSDQLDYRNLLSLLLPVTIVVAGGLGARRVGAAGVAVVVAMCAVGITAIVGVAVDPRLQRPDWKAVAAALGSGSQRAVFMVNGCQLLPLSLYLHGLQEAPAGGAPVTEIDLVSAGREDTWAQVLMSDWYVTCARSRGAAAPSALGPFRATGAPTHVGRFTITRLRASRPYSVTRSALAAAGLRGELMIQRPDRSSQPTNGYAAL